MVDHLEDRQGRRLLLRRLLSRDRTAARLEARAGGRAVGHRTLADHVRRQPVAAQVAAASGRISVLVWKGVGVRPRGRRSGPEGGRSALLLADSSHRRLVGRMRAGDLRPASLVGCSPAGCATSATSAAQVGDSVDLRAGDLRPHVGGGRRRSQAPGGSGTGCRDAGRAEPRARPRRRSAAGCCEVAAADAGSWWSPTSRSTRRMADGTAADAATQLGAPADDGRPDRPRSAAARGSGVRPAGDRGADHQRHRHASTGSRSPTRDEAVATRTPVPGRSAVASTRPIAGLGATAPARRPSPCCRPRPSRRPACSPPSPATCCSTRDPDGYYVVRILESTVEPGRCSPRPTCTPQDLGGQFDLGALLLGALRGAGGRHGQSPAGRLGSADPAGGPGRQRVVTEPESRSAADRRTARLLDAVAVMDRLRSPGGCPWDAEQTHASLLRYLIEECYELVEAVEPGDRAAVREELGDVLLQVLFHARIAAETPRDAGRLRHRRRGRRPGRQAGPAAPARVRRRPPTGATAADQQQRWDELKKTEQRPVRGAGRGGVRSARRSRWPPSSAPGPRSSTCVGRTTDRRSPPAEALFRIAYAAGARGEDPESALRAVAIAHARGAAEAGAVRDDRRAALRRLVSARRPVSARPGAGTRRSPTAINAAATSVSTISGVHRTSCDRHQRHVGVRRDVHQPLRQLQQLAQLTEQQRDHQRGPGQRR